MCYHVMSILTCLFGVAGIRKRRRVWSHSTESRNLLDSWVDRAMESNYDEDLMENAFFQDLRNEHRDIFERAINEGWIICVPRCGSFTRGALLEYDFLGHILVPSVELPVSHFHTLSGKEVRLCNKVLTVEYDIARPCSTHLLFEETFYTDDSHKYRIWCVERPLEQGAAASRDSVFNVTSLRDCVDLLWTEILDKQILENLDAAIKELEANNEHLDNEPLEVQRDLVGALYAKCLRMILKDTRLRERTASDRHFLQIIKVSVETYVLHGLRRILPRAVSSCTAFEDARLNKIIKNLHELQLRDLGVRSDLYDGVVRGKLELSRLDGFSTVLGKLACLKKSVHFVSQGQSSVSSDDLLPVLIFLVIRAGLPNWISQLTFMKEFSFSSGSAYEADEAGFLVTSLEAAVEHVRSGMLTGSVHPESEAEDTDSGDEGSWKEKNNPETMTLRYLFERVRKGDTSEVQRILSKQKIQKSQTAVKLCHPLCSCESCERTLAVRSQFSRLTVHSRDDKGLTVLHIASLYGQAPIVELLLSLGAAPDEADADGIAPLHCAASRGHQNTLLQLLHANANPTIVDTRGNTALHLAADNGHEACVKALLYFSEHTGPRLDTSPRNANADTPLHHAAKWGYTGIVEILLEHRAEPGARNRRGQTPLAIAHSTHISRLLEKALRDEPFLTRPRISMGSSAVSQEPESSQEPSYSTERLRRVERLLSAVTEGDLRLACYYLGLPGPYTAPLEQVSSLCHPLCICDKCSLIDDIPEEHQRKSLLGINASDGDGRTALHAACASGRTEIVQMLLDAGAKVDLKTKSRGQTPLHLACLEARTEVAKALLVSRFCDVDVKDKAGDTPLHLACRAGDIRLVELLVKHGADRKMRNMQGMMPVEEAEERLELEIVRVLNGRALLTH